MTIRSITPFLWFNTQAEDAANFYVPLGPKGSAMVVGFEIAGQRLVALNGGANFKLDEAFSLLVDCTEQEDVDRLWSALGQGGSYNACGWLKDRFGLSWQINYAGLPDLITGPNGDKVMAAMMGMTKINIQALKDAGAGLQT
jgi:predicted 3-demethylubiquinone-9 3-methyltransferase (glyoxalase superfamily)